MYNHTWPGHGQLPRLAVTRARKLKIGFPLRLCGHGWGRRHLRLRTVVSPWLARSGNRTPSRSSSRPPVWRLFSRCLNDLGRLFAELNDFDKALLAHGRAFNERSHRLGLTHLDCAQSLLNMGCVLVSMDQLAAALVPLTEACRIRDRLLPRGHPMAQNAHSWLASCYQDHFERRMLEQENIEGDGVEDNSAGN